MWKQPEKFLDFALLKNPASGESDFWSWEQDRLAVYKLSGFWWQLSRSTPIPQATTPSRDPQGTIDLKEGKIAVKGFECVGDPDLSGVVRCKRVKAGPHHWQRPIEIPGLSEQCRRGMSRKSAAANIISLFTAEGDWTQSDSIRGYLTRGIPLPLVPSGNTIGIRRPGDGFAFGPG